MLMLILAIACVGVASYLVLLLRSYNFLTTAELKRQAREGNTRAKAVYSVKGVYGAHADIFLWVLIGLVYAGHIVLLSSQLWILFVILLAAPITVLVFWAVPHTVYPERGLGLAGFSAPLMKRVLRATHPLFNICAKVIRPIIDNEELQRVNSKDELLEVIRHTQIGEHPFSKDELSIAVHALTFGDRKITEVMTPKSVVKYVRVDDILSPVLLGELHESGFSRFPVIESERGSFVGVLYSKDLGDLRANRSVREVMRPELYYVNEFSSLDNVLNAFLRTQHHLFMVVNEFEEVVGIVTIEDILEQIIGRKIVDEFDQYADLRAVARQLARKEATERQGRTL